MGNDLEIIKQIEKKIEKKIEQLSLDETLGISNGYSIDESGNIVGLNLYDLKLSNISFLEDLKSLTQLDLSSNQIVDISTLKVLKNLIVVDLDSNQITDISPLKELKNLTHLYLEKNQIENIKFLKDLKDLKFLNLNANRIRDISDIKDLTALSNLNLASNQIAVILAVKGLTNLVEIDLDSNQVVDISAVKGLENLSQLSLNSNQIEDISAVKGLKNLIQLSLNSNQIKYISAVKGLKNLTHLYLNSNQIEDISPIKGLTTLIKLNLKDNLISDISPIKDLDKLISLNFKENPITSISPLKYFKRSTRLNLNNYQISNIAGLKELTHLTALDLSDNHISDISILENLNHLTELDLHNNQISDISPLKDLESLTYLDFKENPISSIPPLKYFTRSTRIILSDYQISDISALKDLHHITELDLSNNQISNISSLVELKNLKYLDLGGNQISYISPLKELKNIKYLDLSDNKISDISGLKHLIYLSELDLGNNKISDISPLKDLKNLTYLDFKKNPISRVSPLKYFTRSNKLDLSNYNISDISGLKDLTHLTELDLSNNRIMDISIIKELSNLTKLDLGNNKISDISPLKDLKNLTYLDFKKNPVSRISPLKYFTRSTKLDLSNYHISDISGLEDLPHLTKLDLSNNKILDISALKALNNLTELNLRGNQITDISVLKKLKNLLKLDLRDNQITQLPVEIVQFGMKILDTDDIETEVESIQLEFEIPPPPPPNDIVPVPKPLPKPLPPPNDIEPEPLTFMELDDSSEYISLWEIDEHLQFDLETKTREYPLFTNKHLYLAGNPLEMPPLEIVKQGTEAVRNYFKELENKETVRLLESKLLIVGNGEVGKTTLMRKLKDNYFQVVVGKEATTHGINILPWELDCLFEILKPEKVKIHFWDFGGQEIYHATHQFFLTKRSLYLFVWDPRKEEETRSFDYWFNIIKLLSYNSPVIVVMNKSDIRIKQIDEASFKEKFNNIVGFFQISCLTGKNIFELTDQIRITLGSMPHLRDKLPKVWVEIRDHLKKEESDYISLTEYYGICKKYDLGEERAEYLSEYLHDLGIILHYKYDKLLENIVILNPEWATEAVYTLIATHEIQENKGRFKFDELKRYWDLTKFPREKHAQLICLMEKFELCFPIISTEIHIVPELLPAKRPVIDFGKYDKPGNLHFQYHYDFMPEGIITRFISRMYYLIKEENFWKNGVELQFEDSTAFVLSEPLNRRIKISVTGSCKSELLSIIRNDFEHIHHTLNMEKDTHYDEMIPCTCLTCQESDTPHFFQYEILKRRLSKNKHHAQCLKSDEDVAIKGLLTGFEPPKPKKELLKTLITTAQHLQGISKTIKPDEDSRNSFIALLLSINGFITKDQTRWGRSETGKTMGYVDIKIETPGSEAKSVIEAFNLKGFDRNAIDSHLTKLFGYDPSGLVRNFIIVYSEAADFFDLWKKYLSHLPKIDFKYKMAKYPEEGKTNFADIKLARTKHLREGREVYVYHLFVNMNI